MSMAASPRASEPAIVVMGVSGCGKSAVGAALADALGLPFTEGDGLHPAANVAKMSKGVPLIDTDRWPWLDRVAAALVGGGVVSCSALKRVYRGRLRQGAGRPVAFVFLRGSHAVLAERMARRTGHFMPASLLASQLATLEDPSAEPGVVTIDIDRPLPAIVAEAVAGLCAFLTCHPNEKETLR
jgi:gluconokinase